MNECCLNATRNKFIERRMYAIDTIGLSDLTQDNFVAAEQMALDLSLAYDGQISFLSYVAQSDYTCF
jgi:hypothetical protein